MSWTIIGKYLPFFLFSSRRIPYEELWQCLSKVSLIKLLLIRSANSVARIKTNHACATHPVCCSGWKRASCSQIDNVPANWKMGGKSLWYQHHRMIQKEKKGWNPIGGSICIIPSIYIRATVNQVIFAWISSVCSALYSSLVHRSKRRAISLSCCCLVQVVKRCFTQLYQEARQ